MSTDWNIYCMSCDETHRFNDANHRDADMAVLCKHAAAIAALAPLVNELPVIGLELQTDYGKVDVDWFAKHAGHRLIPISEYGNLLGQCAEYVECVCRSRRRCARKHGHEGDHDPTAPALS